MKLDKLLIVTFLAMCVTGFCMSSVSAAADGTIELYGCGWGSAFKANHQPVNDIPFNDDAWILAFIGRGQFTYYDALNNTIGSDDLSITSGSRKSVNIPAGTTKIDVNAYVKDGDAKKSYTVDLGGRDPKTIRGGLKFDAGVGQHNFHMKFSDSNSLASPFMDSGYVRVKS